MCTVTRGFAPSRPVKIEVSDSYLKHHRANETSYPSAHTCHNMRGVASPSEGDCERRGGIPALAEGSYFRHIVSAKDWHQS
jgi:hypothetical protein